MINLEKITELYATVNRKVIIVLVEFKETKQMSLLCSIDGSEPFVLGTMRNDIGDEALLCEILDKVNQALLFKRLYYLKGCPNDCNRH